MLVLPIAAVSHVTETPLIVKETLAHARIGSAFGAGSKKVPPSAF